MTSSLLVLELKCSRRMRFDPVAAKTCSRADLYISADTDGITMRLSCTYAVGCILGFLNQYINPRQYGAFVGVTYDESSSHPSAFKRVSETRVDFSF
jgi:hypothetical protein